MSDTPLARATSYFDSNGDAGEPDEQDIPAIIGLLNSALPADDPRKITRAHLIALRNAAVKLECMSMDDGPPWADQQAKELRSIAAALESYLPPE